MERAGHTTYTANRQGFIEKNGAGVPYHLPRESSRFYGKEWSGQAIPPTPRIVKVLLKRMERAGHNGPLAQIFSIKEIKEL
jgi:hypothetical protein